MYKINLAANTIEPLAQVTFSSLGVRERAHFQEWIANQPEVLGEELLIIQKEFSGFDDTNERLDLLALDKQGALVVIENKLDDSGRDVVWQALKYTSYCSSLSKTKITAIYQQYLDQQHPAGFSQEAASAEERIAEFMDELDYAEITLNQDLSQRIILIAAEFRKEVTSTVLWLMNFKVQLQCFRATPFAMGEQLFLDVTQIIPTQDTKEYMIGIAEKAQEDNVTQTTQTILNAARRDFWAKLLPVMNATASPLYRNINAVASPWISAGCGMRSISFKFNVSRRLCHASLNIERVSTESKAIFDQLLESKEAIEKDFGGALTWERLNERHLSRVAARADGNISDPAQWDAMIEFMVDAMCRLEKAISAPLKKAVRAVDG